MVAKLTRITSSSSTVRYFERDSGIAPGGPEQYYAGRDFEHRAASGWVGAGARLLKLKGPVEVDDFKAVLRGIVPGTDIQLGRRVVDEKTGKVSLQHDPGNDLTFSAPKSVSMAALLFQEREALDAHEDAVSATLRYIEQHHIETRRNQRRVPTGKMVAATFRHDTSRNHDPQIHTHAIVANMTRREDGKWMSIDRGSVSLNERLIEAYYHNELAKNLREAGYRLRPVQYGALRVFEIDGYNPDALEAFSTRRQDILKDIRERGETYNSASAQRAALRTRRAKEEITREELHRRWGVKVAEMGLENPSSKKERGRVRMEMRKFRERGNDDALGRDIDADLFAAIRTTLEHLGYHTPVISDTVLKARVVGQLAGRVTLGRIEGVLSQMERDGHIFRSKKPGSRSSWVTREALAAERGVVKHMVEGRGKANPIRYEFIPEYEIWDKGLTQGQKDAVTSVITSRDRISGVQGYAGTGKTTMLRTLVKKAGDRKFIGLAPTVGASVLLGAEAGIPSRTLQSFLARHQDIGRLDESELYTLRKEYEGVVLVVDEASMIGTRQMESLFGITDRLGIERVVLVGDSKQLRSIEAGQSFMQLQQHGMETTVMEDIVRQKSEGLRIPVEMVLAGNITCAIERLGDDGNESGRLVEVDREDLHRSAAGLYLQLSDNDQRETIVMAQTNHDRQAINEEIRDGLAEDGHLGAIEYEGERLVNRHMTPTEKADALNYEPGDALVFQSRYRSETGEDHYTVTEVGQNGRLHIESASGHKRDFDPSRGKAAFKYDVFESDDISLRENDLVRFTRNDPDLRDRGVVNGAEATVDSIGPDSITLRMAGNDQRGDGDRVELSRNHNALKHLDHGYCRTTYSAQGRTAKRVIAMADSGLGHIADQHNFYVQISRASTEAVVVTDDIVKMTDNLERNTGEQLTAMEAVGDTGWGLEEDRDIEMPGHGTETEAQDGKKREPELSLPDHFPPELVAMLTRAREEAEIDLSRERAADQRVSRTEPEVDEVQQPAPTIEGKGMDIGEATDTIETAPEHEPKKEPESPHETEATTLEELAEELRQRLDDLPDENLQPDIESEDDAPVIEESPELDEQPMGEIGNGVIQVDDEDLTQETARCWLSLPEEVRERTGILATPGYLRSVEKYIRDELKNQDRLHGPEIEVDRLSLVPFSESEKRYYLTYSRGDMVQMKQDDPTTNIQAGSWVTVNGHQGDGKGSYVLSVEKTNSSGETTKHFVGIDKFSNCQVYRRTKMKLRAGDRIRWRRDSKQHGIVATQKADVTRVAGNNIHLRMHDGRETVLTSDNRLFEACDHAFNLTTWEFAREAVENVIAVAQSDGRGFGVVETIAKEFEKKAGNAVLVTDDFTFMNKHLERDDGKQIALSNGVKGLIVKEGGIDVRNEGRAKGRGIGMGL